MSIHSVSLKNFKSIRELRDLDFKNLNVLIGQNGAGKSNLIEFFKLLNRIFNQDLQVYIKTSGRANSFLYFGQKVSPYVEGAITFRNEDNMLSNNYEFRLKPTQEGGFIFEYESSGFNKNFDEINPDWQKKDDFTPRGSFESEIIHSDAYRNIFLRDFFYNLRIFHFHDTSNSAPVKGFCQTNDNKFLRENASNLAAFLYRLEKSYPKHYSFILRTIQSVTPFFKRFDLKPSTEGKSEINLKWLEKGSDEYFDAHYLSDGTLRFICLTTLLLQPNPPGTIIIDEPELGLHPFAINKIASIIKSVSEKIQIIITTQSVNLLDQFDPEDIIVVEKEDSQSVFKRLDSKKLSDWLEDYSMGELWDKNIIGGRP